MARHADADVAPSKGEKVVGAHGEQAVAAETFDHVPAGHEGHCAVALLAANAPGEQGAQSPEVAFANRPAAHGVHVAGAPCANVAGTKPGAHVHTVEFRGDTMPAPQGLHDEAPRAGAMVLTGQAGARGCGGGG